MVIWQSNSLIIYFSLFILQGLFKERPYKPNVCERNFKHFNECEFEETHWNDILSLSSNDPNLSMDNFYSQIIFLVDEFSPYRKLTKKEIKLKSKPLINIQILIITIQHNKLLHRCCNEEDYCKLSIHNKFKSVRNTLTKIRRESKFLY